MSQNVQSLNIWCSTKKGFKGGKYLTQTAAEALEVYTASVEKGDRSLLDGLSNREIKILRRLALGQTVREITESYTISVKTVDTYRHRLLKKLNLRNNATYRVLLYSVT